jgi:hypothetical protein
MLSLRFATLTDRAFIVWVAREYALVVCISYVMVTLAFLFLFSTPMPEALSSIILLQVICTCTAAVFAISGFIYALARCSSPSSRSENMVMDYADSENSTLVSLEMKKKTVDVV